MIWCCLKHPAAQRKSGSQRFGTIRFRIAAFKTPLSDINHIVVTMRFYLLWLYRFFYVSGKFAQVAGGVGINHLSAFKFAQIALPLCSLAEQQEIVRLFGGAICGD